MSKLNFYFLIKPAVFITALLVSTCLILWIEKIKPSDLGDYQTLFQREILIKKNNSYPLRSSSNLNDQELNYARIAWKYFENNYNASSGFVNGQDANAVFSIKDLGSYLMGMISAYELGIIDSLVLDERIKAFANGLQKIGLCNNSLPNKLYDARTCNMLDQKLSITYKGTGWSALDIGRFYSSINKITLDYPQYRILLKAGLKNWVINDMLINGYLYSGNLKNGKAEKLQEGTLGYEEYSAKNLVMAGYDANDALSYTDFIKFIDIYNNEIAVDRRGAPDQPLKNYLLSEPYILDGLEYGWDNNSRELAYRIYSVQKDRFTETGYVTAFCKEPASLLTETYNCIYITGKQWCCINSKGEETPSQTLLSTKAAFAWHALYNDDYSEVLLNSVKHLNDPQKGWYAGQFEKSGLPNKIINANTNGIILEALNYKMNGRIIKF